MRKFLKTLMLVVSAIFLFAGQTTAVRLQEATPAAVPSGPVHLGGDLPGDPQVQLIKVASGFDVPTSIAFAPGGDDRMFVVEIGGRIKVVHPDGTVEPTPFLDLSETVSGRPGQQGLLGLAFHPDYAKNGLFYVYYNDRFANGRITLSEFSVDAKDPNQADPGSERPLLTIERPYPGHNGGTLRFGADGYLYISTGDGGWQGDALDHAQSRFSLMGKILRIDVNAVTPGSPYGIPADNPFNGPGRYDSPYPGQAPASAEKSGKKKRPRKEPGGISPENRSLAPQVHKEIWAMGFRNPWQFAIDPATQDFYIGDVGSDTWEEINYQPAGVTAGQNYGWDWLESAHCFPAEIADCSRQQVGLLPVAEYQHGEDGCAVIGIGVYRGEESPELDGIFFSGEFCTGEVRGLQRDETGVWQYQSLLDTALQITSSGQNEAGALFVAATTGEVNPGDVGPGSIWKLVGADKVPPAAETVPLGQPRQGDIIDDGMEGTSDGQDAPDAEATPEAAAAPSNGQQVIELYDFSFSPDRFTIAANTDVAVIISNQGDSPHNFELKDEGISVDVAPGQREEVIINLPPGTYKFICNVPGHKQVGMNGALVVK